MSVDFVTALGQVLSSPALQTSFLASPQRVAEILDVSDADKTLFCSLSPEQVNRQARSLITKRMRETYRFLPVTFKNLGNSAAEHFYSYAIQYWPNSIHRHQDDAYRFCLYLTKRRLADFNQSEFNRLHFLNSNKKFAVSLARDAWVKGKTLPAIQLFYSFRNATKEWRLLFKL